MGRSPKKKPAAVRSGASVKGAKVKYFDAGGAATGYKDLSEKSRALGAQLDNELRSDPQALSKLSELNRRIDKVMGPMSQEQVSQVTSTIDQVRDNNLKAAKTAWRKVDDGTDEFVSTSSVIDMLSTMSPEMLDSSLAVEVLKAFSRARLPTSQVGYYFSKESSVAAGQEFQHPTSEDKAIFSSSGKNHYWKDVERRLNVYRAAVTPGTVGVERIENMITRGISETLNKMAAPVSAANITTRGRLSGGFASRLTATREKLKYLYSAITDTETTFQRTAGNWGARLSDVRSPSPIRDDRYFSAPQTLLPVENMRGTLPAGDTPGLLRPTAVRPKGPSAGFFGT